jgi:hypothetical protein
MDRFSTIFSTTILSMGNGKSRGKVIHREEPHLLICGKGLDKRGKHATFISSKGQGRAASSEVAGSYVTLCT